MSSTARLLPVLAGALLLSASSAHATNFAVLFGTSAGDDDQTCNSNLDALHTNSMTFVLNGVSRLSRNTGNDSYSPWDFDDSDDGVVSNPLYEGTGSSGQNPLFEGTAELRQSIHPLSLTIVPSPIDQSWIVTVQAEFTFRPEGVADPEWGQRVVALVTANAGADAAGLPDAVTDHCRARLAAYKKPKEVRVLDSFPLNSTGKIDKKGLRATLESGVGP